MGSERAQLVVTAAMAAVAPIVICVLVIALSSRAANGRLQRNQWVGIRTPSTMRSDQAWMAGHRAALRLTPVYLFTTVIACVALLWAAFYASTTSVVMGIGFGGFAALVALLIYTSVIASRAAKSAEDRHGQ
ncbi:MAG: SdpI family protein [Mycobacterium sp.]